MYTTTHIVIAKITNKIPNTAKKYHHQYVSGKRIPLKSNKNFLINCNANIVVGIDIAVAIMIDGKNILKKLSTFDESLKPNAFNIPHNEIDEYIKSIVK